jgi:hypothetical protein
MMFVFFASLQVIINVRLAGDYFGVAFLISKVRCPDEIEISTISLRETMKKLLILSLLPCAFTAAPTELRGGASAS